jgi:hypothetical protein
MIRTILITIFYAFVVLSQGQNRYWIEGDQDHLQRKYSLEPFKCSNWLQACSYPLNEHHLNEIRKDGFTVIPVQAYWTLANPDQRKKQYGFALEQVHGQFLIQKGLTGKGVKIGIIDGGFLNADTSPSLKNLIESGQVEWYKDYITPDLPPYRGSAPLDDGHGTDVWLNIAGYNPGKNIQFGMATDASFFLARTDHGAYEKRLEEDLLIEAIEDMHKKGVRLINISLGYANGYANPDENYRPEQMDGRTSQLARAVDTAYFKKNMLIVVAAGNEGFTPWKVLSTPGDARGALTVGATKLDIWDKIDYSSIGTPSLDYMKPEISCFATEGTSFSTPIITGLAAAMMQYDSSLTAKEIREIIMMSGNYYPYGNDYLGFGVPDARVIWDILHDQYSKERQPTLVKASRDTYPFKKEYERNYIVAYHKVDSFKVIKREIYRPVKAKFKINRFEDASQTSVLIDNEVTEIIWPVPD